MKKPKIRNTFQRRVITETLLKNPIHPTAEEIYNLISRDHPEIGIATVYRNLKLLEQRGDIIRISTLNAPDRYDINNKPHYHICCAKCGSFSDFELSYKEDFDKIASQKTGYKILGHSLLFIGICPECSNSSND